MPSAAASALRLLDFLPGEEWVKGITQEHPLSVAAPHGHNCGSAPQTRNPTSDSASFRAWYACSRLSLMMIRSNRPGSLPGVEGRQRLQ